MRRLSRLGASRDTLLNQYRLICRSVLETAAPLFAGGLSQTNISDIENVQRSAFKIILRKDYFSYSQALDVLGENTLEERRENISLKFAKKSTNHPKMKHLFKKKECTKTRNGSKFVETKSNTKRGYNNPVKYFIRMLNSQP